MRITRAGLKDTDIFTEEELRYGACCFFTEDRSSKYFFEIRGQEAILFTNTEQYINKAIDEFLFYSGFITLVKDKDGRILMTKTQSKPYLHKLLEIQPSQFYINEDKLSNCKKWIKGIDDIFIPIAIKDGKCISLDGHTRMRAALDLGYTSVYVYPDEYDETIFHFVDEAIKRNVNRVADTKLVSSDEYEVKWNKFCDDLFQKLK